MKKRNGLASALETVDLDKPRDKQAANAASVDNLAGGYTAVKTREKVIHRADPKRCRPWKYADRDKLWFNEDNCSDLIYGFKTAGQEMPALARRIVGEPDFDFEIIWGNRRRWTAEFLAMPLELEITTDDDATCWARMDSENDDKEDISLFEKARSQKKAIDDGLFASGRQLAEARNIGQTVLADNLKAAEMDSTSIMDLFTDIREIPIKPAAKLMRLWGKDENHQGAILAKAQSIRVSSEKMKPAKIIKLLIESTSDKLAGPAPKDYADQNGKVRVKASANNGSLTLKIDKNGISKRDLKKIINDACADFI